MATYILRKLLFMPFILIGVVFITFVLFQMSTSPEALAKIQLGEKASSRVVYEWLVSKGHASWTDAGRDKIARLAEGKLDSKQTQFFVDGRLEDLIDERDEVARRIERTAQRIQDRAAKDGAEESETLAELRGQLAVLLRRQASSRISLKDALLAARRVAAAETMDEDALTTALTIDGHAIDLAFAEADLASFAGLSIPTADAAAAKTVADAAFKTALAGNEATWSRYRAARESIRTVEDITPDLKYTSWVVSFVFYLRDTAMLDFGDTNRKRPVMQVIGEGIGPSLALTLPAFLLAELIGVFFGLLAAMYRQTKIDHVIVVSSILLMSINSIALIMFGQKWLAADLNTFPISGYESGFGAARYLILPMLLYVMIAFGERVRFSRIIMLDETNQDYVRTARAKGLGENRVLFKHILRNTLIPLITRWVVAIPTLYLGSLVLESFFGIPGLGYLTIDAVNNSDANVIRAIVVIGSVGFMFANLLSDVLYAVVDPRVRLE